MDVFVRCEEDDPERLFTYDWAMLVSVRCCSVLCCRRYACANARAQMKACTKEWLSVPIGFFSDHQLRAGCWPGFINSRSITCRISSSLVYISIIFKKKFVRASSMQLLHKESNWNN